MEYFLLFVILLILELVYFKIANRFNIIDKPNQRSSHTIITLRGGGIIFYFAILFFYLNSNFLYSWFFLGLTLMTIISFLDDIFTLSNKVRLIIHFSSVLLLCYQLNIFHLEWFFLIISFIVIVGVINAFNFMDGINGITCCYSLSVCGLLIIQNNSIHFIEKNLLVYLFISILVFGYFNFRLKAKTFAGDVGSVSIAYILLFALGCLIVETGNLIFILFLLVYGVDSIFTIIRRLILKENIFEAHRSHLYQFLVNEGNFNKLIVSFSYGFIQFVLGLSVIWASSLNIHNQFIFSFILICIVSLFYILFKAIIINKFVNYKRK